MNKLTSFLFCLIFSFSLNAQSLKEGLNALDYDKFEQARNIFIKLTETEPANPLNHYYLGMAYISLYKNDLAAKAFLNGVKADATHPANYAGLGRLLLDEQKKTEARAQFEQALALARLKDGRFKDVNAIRYVADAMISGENKMLDEALVLIQTGLELSQKNYDLLITAGDVYIEKNDGGKSASMYEKAIALEPNNPKAYVRVSDIWLRVKNAEATLTELQRALKINENYAPALKSLAEYYYQTRQFEKAKETYARYLENSEPSVANKQRFARILFRSKEFKDALDIINQVLEVDQSDVYLFRLAGYCAYEVGNETKDTNYYRKGIQMMDQFVSKIDTPKVLSNDYEYYGKLYSRLPGNDSLATYYISKAIETDPDKTELYKEAAGIYHRLKKFDQAIFYYEGYISRASRLLPADYYLLGMSSYFGKAYAKADSAFSKVNDMKPDYADAYYWRANSRSAMDSEMKDTLAKLNYEKYASLTESQPEKYKRNLLVTYDYLATWAIQKDDNATAKAYYQKILALDPNNTRAKDVLKQLK